MNSDDARQHLLAHAKLQSASAGDKLLASAQAEALRLRRLGWDDDEIEEALAVHLGELSDGWISRLADQAVNLGFSLGRATEAEDSRDDISVGVYSALLDSSCCDSCSSKDGLEFSLDSDAYEANLPPNVDCAGRDSCRCVMLYVAEEGATKS